MALQSEEEEHEGWSDVVRRRGKQRSVGKSGPKGAGEEGIEEVERSSEGVEKEPKVQPSDQSEAWTDVMPRHRKKGNSTDKKDDAGQADNKPIPPWRTAKATAPKQDTQKGSTERFEALRSEEKVPPGQTSSRSPKSPASGHDSSPKSSTDRFDALRSEDKSPPGQKSIHSSQGKGYSGQAGSPKSPTDRFGVLRSDEKGQKSVKSTKGAGKRSERSEESMSPEDKEKDEMKRKIKSEIQAEIQRGVEGTCVKEVDFTMNAKQYLHAIYNKAGRDKVRDAVTVVRASTIDKTRAGVQNWPGYIATLLRAHYDEVFPR